MKQEERLTIAQEEFHRVKRASQSAAASEADFAYGSRTTSTFCPPVSPENS
jgi:hypothetical protein